MVGHRQKPRLRGQCPAPAPEGPRSGEITLGFPLGRNLQLVLSSLENPLSLRRNLKTRPGLGQTASLRRRYSPPGSPRCSMPVAQGKQSRSTRLLRTQMSPYLNHDAAAYFTALSAKTRIANRDPAATTVQPLPEPGAPTPDVTHLRAMRAGLPQASRGPGAGLFPLDRLWGGASGLRRGGSRDVWFAASKEKLVEVDVDKLG